jgi:hypothetical protein
MSIFTTIGDFVSHEVEAVEGGLKSGEKELLEVAKVSSAVLNAAKAWAASPLGKTLLSIVEAIPVAGPIADEIVNTILPKAIGVVAAVEADASDPEALIAAGLTAIGQKTDANELTLAYTGVASVVTNEVAPLLKVASTLQAAISVTPTAYASLANVA